MFITFHAAQESLKIRDYIKILLKIRTKFVLKFKTSLLPLPGLKL